MGTRSLTKVIEIWEETSGETKKEAMTCMYRQFDGYINGHGKDLAEWLDGFTIVNGIRSGNTAPIFNGMGCLAAQMFEHFKDETGGIYCMHPDTKDAGEEYLYEITNEDNQIHITVYDVPYENEPKKIFHGSPEELLTKLKKEENA